MLVTEPPDVAADAEPSSSRAAVATPLVMPGGASRGQTNRRLVRTNHEGSGLARRDDGATRTANATDKEKLMKITRTVLDTRSAPREWFTGEVYLDQIAAPPAPARLRSYSVHFTPGARTAWHTHPFGQTIFVTEGVGYAQRRGGPLEIIRPGDSVYFEPGEDHWHGATPNRFMTHLALHEVDESGSDADWGPQVSDEEYNAAPAS
jgi:quercetin dioxygenase-like cupin family protein